MPPHPAESPAKKQSKWSAEEDALIIDLRGRGMKWEDISRRLPGRSSISCRLHYQNYLERRSEWDEERKNKLARLYERFKPEMWSKVAEEMAVPWRAAEAMHWQLGEADMARRAGVVPFSLSSASNESTTTSSASTLRTSPNRGHSHSHSQSSISDLRRSNSQYSRPSSSHGQVIAHSHSHSHSPSPSQVRPQSRMNSRSRSNTTGRESTPRSVPPTSPSDGIALAGISGMGRGGQQLLPSVAEMTTGMSPYNTPAYATSTMGYSSPGPILPAIGSMGPAPGHMVSHQRHRSDGKRRSSSESAHREIRQRY